MDPLDIPGRFVFYDATGAIVGDAHGRLRDVQGTAQLNGHQCLAVAAIPDRDAVYIAAGQLKDKAAFSGAIDKTTVKADGVDCVTLSQLPQPCAVLVNSTRYEVSDGIARITFNLPGSYALTVKSTAQLTGTFEVTAA